MSTLKEQAERSEKQRRELRSKDRTGGSLFRHPDRQYLVRVRTQESCEAWIVAGSACTLTTGQISMDIDPRVAKEGIREMVLDYLGVSDLELDNYEREHRANRRDEAIDFAGVDEGDLR